MKSICGRWLHSRSNPKPTIGIVDQEKPLGVTELAALLRIRESLIREGICRGQQEYYSVGELALR